MSSEAKLLQVDYVKTPDGYQESSREPQKLKGIQNFDLVDYGELLKRIQEGNETYDRPRGPSGRRYEILIFNAGKLSVARIVKPTTSFSGALKNPANVLETVFAATVNPGAAYILATSHGNYPTGSMDYADLRHVATTGRSTKGSGTDEDPYRPLDSLEDMAAMLDDQGLSPTHFVADEEAGRTALGLMTAMAPNTVKGAYLNGIDGISPTDNYVMAQFSDDIRSRLYRRGIKEDDPGLLIPANIKNLKRNMPRIYHGIGRVAHIAPLPVFLFPQDVWHKAHLTLGHRGHNDLDHPEDHAVFHDLQAGLRNHEATITMQFNTESVFADLVDCRRFGRMSMDALPENLRSNERKVRLVIGEGNHNAHTDNPYGRSRVERYALSDIMQKMVGLAGSYAVDRYLFDLKPVKEAA